MREENCFTLEDLGERVGLAPRTIRDYRQRGLLPPAHRRGARLLFDERHVEALYRIFALQKQGMNLVAIKSVLAESSDDEDVCDGIRLLASCDRDALSVLCEWRVVARVDGGHDYEWRGGKPLLTAMKRVREPGSGVVAGLRVVARLLGVDLVGGASVVDALHRVDPALVRRRSAHDLVCQVVRHQLGAWAARD